jgi:hypothetical protein
MALGRIAIAPQFICLRMIFSENRYTLFRIMRYSKPIVLPHDDQS